MRIDTLSRSLVALALFLGLVAGCTKPSVRPRVHGKVSVAGAPLGNQTLTLISEGKPGEFFTQKIAIQSDGSFDGEVSTRGKYKVVIEESMAVQENKRSKTANTSRVPSKYRKEATSNLIWGINADDNYREFNLAE